MDKTSIFTLLAQLSGGHPRTVQWLIEELNKIKHLENIEKLIARVTDLLLATYIAPSSWKELFKVVLLGQKVELTYMIGDETVKSLINRGILTASLSPVDKSVIPRLPEIFLLWFSSDTNPDNESKDFINELRLLLSARRGSTRKKWEDVHGAWERLMRYVRPISFERIALWKLYNFKEHTGDLWNVEVNGCARLEILQYRKNEILKLKPNTWYNTEDDNQPGWDKLMVLAAFPHKQTTKKFILPVFIQNKFSKEDSTTFYSLQDVEESRLNCKKFMKQFVTVERGQNLLPKRFKNFTWFNSDDDMESNFVLIFLVKGIVANNAIENCPNNVKVLEVSDLPDVYGPTIAMFVNSLVPDDDFNVLRKA